MPMKANIGDTPPLVKPRWRRDAVIRLGDVAQRQATRSVGMSPPPSVTDLGGKVYDKSLATGTCNGSSFDSAHAIPHQGSCLLKPRRPWYRRARLVSRHDAWRSYASMPIFPGLTRQMVVPRPCPGTTTIHVPTHDRLAPRHGPNGRSSLVNPPSNPGQR